MSLIEKLGGYRIKISDLECYQYHKESLETYERTKHLNVFGMTAFRANIVRKSLLQYRREHNIFEVGDWVVIDSYKPEFQFYQLTEDDIGSHWINLVDFRHATDKEIEQGCRNES